MGAAGSGTLPGGWLLSGSNAAQVSLALEDARYIALLPGEELEALVHVSLSDPGSSRLTRRGPATVSVGPETVLFIEFQTVVSGLQETARCVGEVSLPLDYIVRHCGGSLNHIWQPLQPSSFAHRLGGETDVPDIEQHVQLFQEGIRTATRDLRKPMVSLSLFRGSSIPSHENFMTASNSEKAANFISLQQSHVQQARMLQALYRQVRNNQAAAQSNQQLPEMREGLSDSWSHTSFSGKSRRNDRMDSFATDPSQNQNADLVESDHRNRDLEDRLNILRQDIAATTEDANARINQATKSIQTLEEKQTLKQVDLLQKRKEVARLWHDAEAVELENQKLELQLQRRSLTGSPVPDSLQQQEMEKLGKEQGDLTTQKEALLLILKDFYGAMGKEPPSLEYMINKHSRSESSYAQNAPVQPTQHATPSEAPVPQEDAPASHGGYAIAPGASASRHDEQAGAGGLEQTGWSNMLPRPSELLSTGLLQPRSSMGN